MTQTDAKSIQKLYNVFYIEMRKYIWDFQVIEHLADLEISIYKVFPDIDEIKRNISVLRRDLTYTDILSEDAELKESFDDLENYMKDVNEIVSFIPSFREVVTTYEDKEEPEERDSENRMSAKFHRRDDGQD